MKSLLPSIIVAVLVVGGAIFLVSNTGGDNNEVGGATIVDGKQIIDVLAKGGYYPSVSIAKAGVPTVLRVKTRGTFDCSAALTIPSVGYRSILPNNGETLIEIPPQAPGSVVEGICSMGMYNFKLQFN